MPEISVIVPVYKVEPYLRECVDSILAQTFTDFELILIDDGSPDNCGIICDEYAERDNRIIVIHQENGGLSAARNSGLDVAKGEYVTFIDSDDVVSPLYLNHLYNNIIEKKCDIVSLKQVDFNRDSLSINYKSISKAFVMTGKESVISLYSHEGIVGISAWGKLYRSILFKSIRFPNGKIHEDQAIVPVLLYCAEKVYCSLSEFYGYRLRENSIMSSAFTIKRYDNIEALMSCLHFFNSVGEKDICNLIETELALFKYLYQNEAKRTGLISQVPKKYRVKELRTLYYLRNHLTDSFYTYQLAKYHPRLVLPHEYIRKIKKILGIKVKD